MSATPRTLTKYAEISMIGSGSMSATHPMRPVCAGVAPEKSRITPPRKVLNASTRGISAPVRLPPARSRRVTLLGCGGACAVDIRRIGFGMVKPAKP
jgi:hypothetical protein